MTSAVAAAIKYHPAVIPQKVGEWRGEDVFSYGATRIEFSDRFCQLVPHTGTAGSASPPPLHDPDYLAALVTSTGRARNEYLAERGRP